MKIFISLVFLLLISCGTVGTNADLVVINANIYTVDPSFSTATALAVKDGRFIDVGSNQEIEDRYRASQVIDANGKTIVPGLIDAHCHFYGLGLTEQQVELRGTQSFEEVLERVNTFYTEKQPSVIVGRGWDQNDWKVKRFPTRDRLDELYPEIPVVLERIDGHAFLVNQKALDMAGIDRETEAVGGEIIKRNGIPTGILIDGPMKMVESVLPPPDLNTMVRALKDAEKICFDYGLTTVNDAGLHRDVIELIDSLQQAGELKMRMYAMVSHTEENLDHFLPMGVVKTDRLHVGSVKVYADGALGSRGATLKAPYSDQAGHYGAMVTPVGEIEALAMRLKETDYQMNTHAIGDSANAVVLRAYKKALNGTNDRRWKIEHAQVVDLKDMEMFKEGIIPSVQPTHATSDMYWAEDRLGAERMEGAYAFKKLLDKMGIIALGTDFPVEEVNPFHTFYAAVARKDLEQYPEGGFRMQEALSREEALKGMTIWAAYSNFEAHEKGSIEVGKWADFVVLSNDLMQMPVPELRQLSAEQVFVAGEQVK